MEETKKTYDELKDKYDELNADYVAKYFALKDKYKKEQAELREQYLFDRLMVEKPLKAEKYNTAHAEHCHQIKECDPYAAK